MRGLILEGSFYFAQVCLQPIKDIHLQKFGVMLFELKKQEFMENIIQEPDFDKLQAILKEVE